MNDIFALIDNPPEFKVDRDYERQKKKIEEAKGKALYGNGNIDIKTRGLCDMVRSYIKRPQDVKSIGIFLNKIGAEYMDLLQLSYAEHVDIRLISPKAIELKVNEDKWRIVITKDGYYRTLLHNSYVIKNYIRVMKNEFHFHFENKHIRFSKIIDTIVNYRADYHVEKKLEAENYGLHLAPENDLGKPKYEELFRIPNAVRLKKIKFFYDRYMYIDVQNGFNEAVFKKKDIGGKNVQMVSGKESDFVVIVRDIPKWQRKKVFAAMNEIKSRMFKHGYKDVHICGIAMLRYLDKNKVKYSTWFEKKAVYES